MPGYKDVIAAIHECGSLIQIMERLKMPPSLLRKILRSPRFRQQMEVEKLITQVLVQYQLTVHAGIAASSLGELTVARREESARKASMAVLSRTVDADIMPELQTKPKPDYFPGALPPPPPDTSAPVADQRIDGLIKMLTTAKATKDKTATTAANLPTKARRKAKTSTKTDQNHIKTDQG